MSDKHFLANARCIPLHHESNHQQVRYRFDKVSEGITPKDKSKLMVMKDRRPLELWDWGLNEKVIIPDENTGCLGISEFIEFIKTRKW